MKKPVEKSNEGHTYVQWLVAIIANINLLTYGMQAGWVSPSIKVLQSDQSPTGRIVSDSEISWIGGILGLAGAVGVSIYTCLSDRYGRKTGIIAIAFLQTLGWAVKISATNTWSIILARVFCGLAAGGCFVVIPMYVKEICQDNIRGLVGCLLILFQNMGFLVIYAMGAYFGYYTVLWISLALPIITMAAMIKAPESPSFLIKLGKVEEATATIAFLRGLDEDDSTVQKEINLMKKEDLHYKSLPSVSVLSIFKDKAWRRGFILMMCIISIHASNGSFAIVTYASVITASSSTAENAELQTLTFPAVMILASFVSMSCVERFGRKPLLAFTISLIVAAMLCIATVVLLREKGFEFPVWVPLSAIIVTLAAYAAGLSPVPFIMMSEIFNFQIRAKAMGLIVTYSWLQSFIQLVTFNPLANAIGFHGAFYFYAAINVVGLFISVVVLPETKGKTVEQIEIELRGK